MPLLICPKCRKRFGSRKALGGGWRGTRKVLGCPSCRTFFVRLPYLDGLGLALGLANVLFAAPYLLYPALALGDTAKLLNGLLALTIGAWLVLGNRYLFRKNVRGREPIYSPPWERP
jgi:hypothetical protein